jgi:hypothetical protein
MGWSFMSDMRTKSEIIAYLTGPNLGTTMKTVAKCLKGNTLWTVHEYLEATANHPVGKRWIGCYLLGADKGWWGYKDMDESMGPTEVSCPLSYLDMVPDPGGYATAWRERVKAHHATLAKFNSLTVGAKVKLRQGVTLSGEPLTEATIVSVRPLRATVLANSTFPRTVSLSKKHIDTVL